VDTVEAHARLEIYLHICYRGFSSFFS